MTTSASLDLMSAVYIPKPTRVFTAMVATDTDRCNVFPPIAEPGRAIGVETVSVGTTALPGGSVRSALVQIGPDTRFQIVLRIVPEIPTSGGVVYRVRPGD